MWMPALHMISQLEDLREVHLMATYTVNLFTTLDGFGTGPVAYWGKDGPELRAWHARTFFGGSDQMLVFGANTYRMMAHYATLLTEDPNFASLSAARKVVISRTLEGPPTWANTTHIADDARAALPRLKAESPVPLYSHGSITMNRALLAAGLVDRLEVVIFPMVSGATGSDPILASMPDIDLELIDSQLFDGRVQLLAYAPTVR
jgi:dihydrofolate reductase